MKSGSEYGPRCDGSYCCGTRWRPEVWLASWPSVTRRMSPPLLQLGHVFGDRVVERDLALLDRLRQQGGGEHLADRGEVEQRIRRHRLLAGGVGHAVVEEHGAAVDVERDRHAAGREQERLDVTGDEVAQLGVGLGPRRRGGDCGGERNEAERRHHCSRHAAHRSLLSGTTRAGPTRTSHHSRAPGF